MNQIKLDTFESLYKYLLAFHKKTCDQVYILSSEQLKVGAQALLEGHAIQHDEILRFEDDSIGTLNEIGYSTENAGGLTVNYLNNGAPKSAIFLHENPLKVDAASNNSLIWCVLYMWAVAGAECNTVIELKPEHHAASPWHFA